MSAATPAPFAVQVGDDVLADLAQRLARVRWPDEPPAMEPWQVGTDLTYLQQLTGYWRDGFDWHAQEARLNRFPQFRVALAEIDLHYLHVPGTGPRPLPLLLLHGWPGSVWEFHKIIPMLTDPARFGADPADAFTVVAPSLPGYGFSFRPGQPRFGAPQIADVMVELMTEVLGYDHFVAQGGDWGAFVSSLLGLAHAEHVDAIHLNMLPLRRDGSPPADDTPEMAAYRAELAYWVREETGYSSIQGTKPQTLAYALTDSPVGLAAWILEKFQRWSDCDGDLARCYTRDELLTNIMLYWVTGAIGSSFWPYWARQHSAGWPLPGTRRVEVPTGYASFPKDILHPPRELAERAFNIQRWTVMPRGGHFAALEQPELLAHEVRAFFRDRR
ncbi:MAG: alpha/beta fold hydrolase [Chloroflexi bacterium]|nr:alpha/beta fold hydrolase [Chloroflexota bacterium]